MYMRIEYMMYVIAGLFFVITIISAITTVMETTQRSLWVASTVVLGLLSIGFGYYKRPRAMVQASQSNVSVSETVAPQRIQASIETATVVEKLPVIETTLAVESPTQPSIVTETTSNLPVTHVKRSQVKRIKGIGQKRAAQLSSLGINSFEELSKASVDDIAKSLQISPKIVMKWISEAKVRTK